ncbi:MAG TPA: tetratricopeptide repeat protein [Ktedonobacterales bacterium]
MPPRAPFTTAAERRVMMFSLTGSWLVAIGLLGLLITRLAAGDAPSLLDAYLATISLVVILALGVLTVDVLRSPVVAPSMDLALTPTLPAADPLPAQPAPLSPAPAPGAGVQPAPAVAPPQPQTGAPRIFISHSSGDNTFGDELVSLLRAAGCDVWYDSQGRPDAHTGEWQDGLYAGDSWQNQIVKELTERNVFVVILTQKAVASKWVQDELQLAWSDRNSADVTKGKVIVPVLRETCDIPKLLTLIQYVDYRPEADQEKARTQLLDAVRRKTTIPMPTSTVGPPFDLGVLPPLEHFVGREDDVAWVIERLTRPADGDGQLASIAAANGLAGIGKTALATEVAWRLWRANTFPDGIAVVICKDQRDPLAILRSVLGRFTPGRVEPEDDDLAKLGDVARKLLADKRALVILDNVEDGWPVGQVLSILRTAGAAVMLTSRALLPAVPMEASRMLELLPLDEALDVFAEYLGRGKALDLTRLELEAATTIVTALGRHTLAVKLAAAQAATLHRPLATVAAELEANPDRALLLANGEEAVRYLLDSSYAALQDAEQPADAPSSGAQRLFIALAAFATADIGRKAMLDVADSLGIAEGETALGKVIALRLVEAGENATLPPEADRERIRFHPLVQTYVHTLFKDLDAGDQQAAHTAVAVWYANYANDHFERVAALTADEANITGALEWMHEHTVDDLEMNRLIASICNGMRGFWRDTGRTRAGLTYLPWGIEAAEWVAAETKGTSDKRLAANIALYYGEILRSAGRLPEAEKVYKDNLELRRQINDRQGEGVVLSSLGQIAFARGRLEEAAQYFEQSLVIRRETQDRRGEGVDLSSLGQIAVVRGRQGEAERYFQEGLAIDREVQERRNEGVVLASLGYLARERGQLEAAQAYYEQSLVIRREVQDRQGEGAVLSNLGRIALERGRMEEAEQYFQQRLVIAREVEDRKGEGIGLAFLANLEALRERYDEAESYYRQALALARETEDAGNIASMSSALGELLIVHRNKRDEGCQMLAEAARLYDQMGIPGAEEARETARRLGCG